MKLRVALAQINSVVGDIPGNTKKILDAFRQAQKAEADIILFPELALCGYPPEDLLLKPHFVRACQDALQDIARQARGIIAVVGLPMQDNEVHNAAALCADSQVSVVYRKICLPNYGVFDERRYFAEGKTALVFNIDGNPCGMTVCEDLWISDGPQVDCVARGGAKVIFNISASPFHRGKTLERERMLIQRAVECGAYVVFCNAVGGQDELVFDGSSCVIDPDGGVVARAPAFEEDLLVFDLDLDRKFHGPLRNPSIAPQCTRPLQRVDLPFEPVTGRQRVPDTLAPIPGETELILRGIQTGLRDYVRKNGFSQVVVGLSGGVDSALVATLAARALGPSSVLGLFLPTRFSSSESAEDAKALADNLGIEFRVLPMEDAVRAMEEMMAPIFSGRGRDVTEENIQARLRGCALMAVANKFQRLLLATGNKSEMSVGYATLYGDMAGAFAPIKDLPKTKVYDLCRLLNEKAGREIIPQRVLTKAPTAELRENQKDSDTLPDYKVLDDILSLYVEQTMSYEQIRDRGFDAAVVAQVIRMVNAGEYKRRQAAPGVKISSLAFGRDRRLPITNHYGETEIPPEVDPRGNKQQ